MANYNVDIAVVIKGNEKLTKFKNTTKALSIEIQQVNKALKVLQLGGNGAVRSFNSLNNVLADARANFNAVASGTLLQQKAARQLVLAEKELNREYQQRERLLENIRRNQSGFAQFSRSASQVSSPTVFNTGTQKSIDRNRRNQNRRAGRNPVPFGPQPFIGPLPMQGPMFGPMQGPMPMMTVDNNPRILRNLEASRISREASGFGIRPGTQYERPIGPAFSAVMKSQLRHQKKIDKNTGKTAQLLSASNNRAVFSNQIAGTTQYSAPIGPSRAPLLNRLGFGQGANPRGAFANSRGRAGRISGSISSGLIGGGFPLLFGQGPLASLGGGIGGLAGGALGGGFGFGLSIAGTAIASRIQESIDFRKSISELNKEMEKMGISSNISARGVNQLAKSLGITKEEAVTTLQEFKRFGNDAVLIAKKFGGDFGRFDALSQANTVESALSAIRKINKDLTLEEELRLVLSIQRRGVEATINDVVTDTLDKQKQLDTEGFGQGVGGRKRAKVLEREREQTKEINTENAQLINKFNNIKILQDEIRIANEETSLSIVKGLQDVNAEIRRLNSAQFQVVELSKTLGSAFSESFKGIIKETMSVQEAFRSMFMRIADHFLDMAAQMAAAQIQRGFMGLFANMFGNNFTRSAVSATPTLTPDQQVSRFTFGKADGGPVKGGNSYIVGERGPELFSPGVSGMITPNEMLGGSTNIVVNVDASGSNVEGDEEQGRELGRLISVAVQSEIIQQQRPGGLLA